MFTLDERVDMARQVLADIPNVGVTGYSGITIEYARAHGLQLRPHTKTHKSPVLGARQLAHGAVGLTVAKVSEAEVMLASGVKDILIAYPVFGAAKMRRLVEVAKKARVKIGRAHV